MTGFVIGALVVAVAVYAWLSISSASATAQLEADYQAMHAVARAELNGDEIVRLTAALRELRAFGLSDPDIQSLSRSAAKRVMVTKAIQTMSSFVEIKRMFQPSH